MGQTGMEWHSMVLEWHGVTWHGIGLNYTYKEILNALKTKGRCKYTPLLKCTSILNYSDGNRNH